MLEIARKLIDEMQSEFEQLIRHVLLEECSEKQRIANASGFMNRFRIYCGKLETAVDCVYEYGMSFKTMESATLIPGNRKLKFTDPKMGLIELGYALQEKGAFNNGNTDLKMIFDYFSLVFDVDFSNTSKSYQDLVYRKINQVSYLPLLKHKLENKLALQEGRW